MQGISKCMAAGLVLTLAGCASRGDLANVQRDIDEVKIRSLKVEKDLSLVGRDVRDGLAKNIKGFQGDVDTLRRGTADLQANLDSLRVDLQVLSGKVDDLALLAKKPGEDIPLMKEELERRLTALAERLTKLEKGFEEQQGKSAEARVADLEKTPEALYHKGLDTFRGGDSQKGRGLLSRFLELYPKHELAANARYWLGETYYADKLYDQAILEFQEVIKNYPGKDKVPAALLKQGMAFRELGDMKSARYVLKKLVADFSATDEAKAARETLKELK